MISHIMIGANDVHQSQVFYDAILGVLGIPPAVNDERGRAFYASQKPPLIVSKPINGQAATGANGGTLGFVANDAASVVAWHEAGLANGGTTCEDPPGERIGHRGRKYYAAYLLDPSGNKICAVYHPT